MRKGNKWNGPARCPSLLPGGSDQATAQRGAPRQSQGSHWDKEAEAGAEGGRGGERSGKSGREETAAWDSSRGLQWPLESSCRSLPAYEETTEAGKIQQKGASRVILRVHTGREVVHASATQNFREKPWNIWCSGHSSQKITVLVVGPN